MLKRQIALTLLMLFGVTTLLFGHAGEVHTYMGTVTTLQKDGSFVIKMTDGKDFHVHVARTTAYLRADGKAATATDLKAGSRVVVKIAKDGKTALSVRIAQKKRT